jgi:hypothetical protein
LIYEGSSTERKSGIEGEKERGRRIEEEMD